MAKVPAVILKHFGNQAVDANPVLDLANRLHPDVAKLYIRSKQASDEIMEQVVALANEQGGMPKGLEHRCKTLTSLKDKYQRQGNTKFRDACRYTIVFKQLEFSKRVKHSIDSVRAQNCSLLRCSVSYGEKGLKRGYIGCNTAWWHTNGKVLFELQFHTPQTFAAKMATHKEYEEARQSKGLSKSEQAKLWEANTQAYVAAIGNGWKIPDIDTISKHCEKHISKSDFFDKQLEAAWDWDAAEAYG